MENSKGLMFFGREEEKPMEWFDFGHVINTGQEKQDAPPIIWDSALIPTKV